MASALPSQDILPGTSPGVTKQGSPVHGGACARTAGSGRAPLPSGAGLRRAWCRLQSAARGGACAAISDGGRCLSLQVPDVKADRLGLMRLLPAAIAFAIMHLKQGHRILVLDAEGMVHFAS